MGFALPGFTGEDLARDFARTPLARLAKRPDDRIHLRPRVSLSLHLTSSANKRETPATEKTTLLGFLRQYAPKRLSKATSGLWVHLTPRRTSLPTDRRSWEAAFARPESLGTAGGAKPRDPYVNSCGPPEYSVPPLDRLCYHKRSYSYRISCSFRVSRPPR